MAKPVRNQAPENKWRDLREWLQLVETIGELKTVRGANSEEDIGAITEMLDHAEESPCVLFDEIPNYKPGHRVLVNSMGSRKRQAITLGLDPEEASHLFRFRFLFMQGRIFHACIIANVCLFRELLLVQLD